MTFLIYKELAKRQNIPLSNLQTIIRDSITNTDTLDIIDDVCSRLGNKKPKLCPPELPGLLYDVNSDEGKALLGTPNARGAGWLLAQHRAAFPDKTVTSLRIFGFVMDADLGAVSAGRMIHYG